MEVFRTIFVPASMVTLSRALAGGLSSRGVGMFLTATSGSGTAPAEFYLSSGFIDEEIAPLLTDAAALHAACVQAGASVTLAQCQQLVAQSDVSMDIPEAALQRKQQKLVEV